MGPQSGDLGGAQAPDTAMQGRRGGITLNLVANLVGRGWAALAALVFVPAYLDLLGPEAYGLIGMFAVVQAWTLLFDFGLTPTLNREMARANAGARTTDSLRDLLVSFERLALALAILVSAIAWISAPAIADGWLHPQSLSLSLVTDALRLIGMVAALRWWEQLYRAGVQGREDQVWLNLVHVIVETLRWGGAYLVLRFGGGGVLTFFAWQLAVAIGSLLVVRRRLWRTLPPGTRRSRFAPAEIRGIGAFAGGMFASALLTFAITQADKLVVSRMLPLGEVGYYMLAAMVAAGLLQIIQPLNIAVLPRLTALVASGDRDGERALFLRASEAMAMIVLPVGLLIVSLPEAFLIAWTGDPAVAGATAPVLALLAVGMVLNALLNIPYMLQLAHGWPGLSVRVNCVLILLLLPLLILATDHYGMAGAAGLLACAGLGSIAATPKLMFDRILPDARARWWTGAVIVPLAATAIVAAAARLLLPLPTDRVQAVLWLLLSGAAILAAAVGTTNTGRLAVRHLVARGHA